MAEQLQADDAILGRLRDEGASGSVIAFAMATLRRVPVGLLHRADPATVATRLRSAFAFASERAAGATAIRITRPTTTLDGQPGETTVVEVATDDRPFLLSTVTDAIERRGLRIQRALHPIVGVERGSDGQIARIVPARDAEQRDSVLYIELQGRLDDAAAADLESEIRRLVRDVRHVTDDHDAMRTVLRGLAEELRTGEWRGVPADEAREVADLLDWLLDDNLVLLGVREYLVLDTQQGPAFSVRPGSGRGLLRDESRSRFAEPIAIAALSPQIRDSVLHAPLLTLTRTTARSTVQRQSRMEYFGLTQRDDRGGVLREIRILGLFTRKGYAEPASSTPVLRDKLRTIMEREDVVEGSHDAITLVSLFQALPKDELFQSSPEQLHATLVDLLHAEAHGETRTRIRIDHRSRTVSVVVAVPRDRYGPQLRTEIQELLLERFEAASVEAEIALGDRQEALVRFLLHVDHQIPEVPEAELQLAIRALARTWLDQLDDELRQHSPAPRAAALLDQIGQHLPHGYRELTTPADAVGDIELIDAALRTEASLLVAFRSPSADPDDAMVDAATAHELRLRAVKRGDALELSTFLPILESLGLTVVEEIPHRVEPLGTALTLHDFGVRARNLDAATDGTRVADAIHAAWRGHLVIDALNEVVLTAGTDWRDVSILRAYRRLRRQLGTAYTPDYVNRTLVDNAEVVAALVAFFHTRFDPEHPSTRSQEDEARQRAVDALDGVGRLDHDRILRGIFELIDATLRTNAFRPDAVADVTGEPYIALKLDPSRVQDVPQPVPYREIFVHSPRVEGVHLRAGAVARGGLRWSDRRDDVRTEVLGLVKAQILKNAVIVPTGAKGGFVLTDEPEDPAALREEVRRQYVTFIRGLLDVTDDLDGDTVVPPPGVRRHDGDDTYLVVAADRGTATFSDTANELAARYGFWLDDAFASGGSQGYDHKALGVTARGAWVAVRRHFRELGIDTQTEPITVAGVGDMSGDVFGNGMLRSRTVRLVAAFDHRHIFLDPDPDPERSFVERERLFALPRSSWDDYDRAVLSAGGGVHSRAAKRIALSAEVRAALRIDADELTPPELIRAILRAPVDLLFAGGIGTYIRASTERDADVGDRANDEVRVAADEVRARVIGEGANLFATQAARIEYARHGGRCNQDAIDNAGGVVTSDLEVTMKILLRLAEDDGRLDRAGRDALLAQLSDEVVEAVLRTVDRQTAALSRELVRSPDNLAAYDAMLTRLERTARLDRDAELAPSSDELAARQERGAGLTRPELATLLAWAKRELKEALLASDVPDDPMCAAVVARTLPPTLVERFGDLLPRHRLHREIVATSLANDLVDRLGVTFVSHHVEEAAIPISEVVRAAQAARTMVDADRWWALLDELDEVQEPERVRELEAPLEQLLRELTTVLLDRSDGGLDAEVVDQHRRVVAALLDGAGNLGTEQQRSARIAHARWLIDDLVDPDLARFLACARDLSLVPDAVRVLALGPEGRSEAAVVDTLLRLGDALAVDRLEESLRRAAPAGAWSQRQQRGLAADLRRRRHDAAAVALRETPAGDERAAVDRFLVARASGLAELQATVTAVEGTGRGDLDAVGVAERQIRALVDTADRTG